MRKLINLLVVIAFLGLGAFGLDRLEAQKKGGPDPTGVPKKEEIPKYIEDLKSSDAKVRQTAAAMLGNRGAVKAADVKDSIPAILELVKSDSEAQVRQTAARALGKMDPDPATVVPVLVEAFKNDKEMSVRVAAAQGLGALGAGAKDAMPALREAADMAKKAGKDDKDKQAIGRAAQGAMRSIGEQMKK